MAQQLQELAALAFVVAVAGAGLWSRVRAWRRRGSAGGCGGCAFAAGASEPGRSVACGGCPSAASHRLPAASR